MELSQDGLTLIRVAPEDIINGTVMIPPTVVRIGNGAFEGLSRRHTPLSWVEALWSYLFNFNVDFGGLREITIPEHVTEIAELAFNRCSDLERVNILGEVTRIGRGAFSGCFSLEEVVLPDSVQAIEDGAFYDCQSLERINFPINLISIGRDAFNRCRRLRDIPLPGSLTSIGDRAFEYCFELQHLTLPNSLRHIGERAFHCSLINELIIPHGFINIGTEAFAGLYYLTRIIIPDSVTVISDLIFRASSNLEVIIIDTKDEAEFQRVKHLLRSYNRLPIISVALYQSCVDEKERILANVIGDAYTSMLNYAFPQALPYELIAHIEGFNTDNEARIRLNQIPVPRDEAGLDSYKNELRQEAERVRTYEREIGRDYHHPALTKLTAYCERASEGIERALARSPRFFDDKQEQLKQKRAQIDAIQKVITFLETRGEGIMFTQEEVHILFQGVVGKILQENYVILPTSENRLTP